MITIYTRDDCIVKVAQIWTTVTEKNIIGIWGTTENNEHIILGTYDSPEQVDKILEGIYAAINGAKFKMPEPYKEYPKELEEKCAQCLYYSLSLSDLDHLGLCEDPCETCDPETLSNWKAKEREVK